MADTKPNYVESMNRGHYLLIEMVDQYYTESQEAFQSRNGNELHEADLERNDAYMDDIDNYIDYWTQRKKLDLNHTSNMKYRIPDLEMPVRSKAQNLFWYDHLLAIWQMRDEMRKSQTRNQAQGVHESDVKRWKALTEDRRTFFRDYTSKINPVDRPQSSSPEQHYTADRTDYSPGEDGPIVGGEAA